MSVSYLLIFLFIFSLVDYQAKGIDNVELITFYYSRYFQ